MAQCTTSISPKALDLAQVHRLFQGSRVATNCDGEMALIWLVREDLWNKQTQSDAINLIVHKDGRWFGYHLPYALAHRQAFWGGSGALWGVRGMYVCHADLLANSLTAGYSAVIYDRIAYACQDTAWLLRSDEPVIDICSIINNTIKRIGSITWPITDSIKDVMYSHERQAFYVKCLDKASLPALYCITNEDEPQRIAVPADGQLVFCAPFLFVHDPNKHIIYYTTDPAAHWHIFDPNRTWQALLSRRLIIDDYKAIMANGAPFVMIKSKMTARRWVSTIVTFTQEKSDVIEVFACNEDFPEIGSVGNGFWISLPKGGYTRLCDAAVSSQKSPSLLVYAPAENRFKRGNPKRIEHMIINSRSTNALTPKAISLSQHAAYTEHADLDVISLPITSVKNSPENWSWLRPAVYSKNSIAGFNKNSELVILSEKFHTVCNDIGLSGSDQTFTLLCGFDSQGGLWASNYGSEGDRIIQIDFQRNLTKVIATGKSLRLIGIGGDKLLVANYDNGLCECVYDDRAGRIIQHAIFKAASRANSQVVLDAKYSRAYDEWLITIQTETRHEFFRTCREEHRVVALPLPDIIPDISHITSINLFGGGNEDAEYAIHDAAHGMLVLTSDPRIEYVKLDLKLFCGITGAKIETAQMKSCTRLCGRRFIIMRDEGGKGGISYFADWTNPSPRIISALSGSVFFAPFGENLLFFSADGSMIQNFGDVFMPPLPENNGILFYSPKYDMFSQAPIRFYGTLMKHLLSQANNFTAASRFGLNKS